LPSTQNAVKRCPEQSSDESVVWIYGITGHVIRLIGMVTGNDYPPNWVILPGSSLTAELVMRDWTKKPIIEICGNRQGLVSLGNLLLWVSLHSADTESLSITGLPFVHVKSALSLTVVQPMHGSDSYGKLVRVDKHMQFQWLVKDDVL